jgi:Protein of unknown function (DUF742)/CHAT domain/MmoB/DmpM family
MSSKDAGPRLPVQADPDSGPRDEGPERSGFGFFAREEDGATSLVRPYSVTGGRTQPHYQLALEALVTATLLEPQDLSALGPEVQAILELCQDWRSVAEISALLRIPLGVTRILIADMAADGLVRIHQRDDSEGRPDLRLLERVLSELRDPAAVGGKAESADPSVSGVPMIAENRFSEPLPRGANLGLADVDPIGGSAEADSTAANICGFILANNPTGGVVAQVMSTKPNVRVTMVPSMIRVEAIGRIDVVYDEISRALGQEPGFFDLAEFEGGLSTHYGRMIHRDDRTIFFAHPEDAAEYLGFSVTSASNEAAGIPQNTGPASSGPVYSGPASTITSGGGPEARDPAGGGDPQGRRRYLRGQCPESVPVGKPFSLLASIVLAAGYSSAELEPFDVPPEGRDVLLVVHAPRLRLLGDQHRKVHVPSDADSRPVRFELQADAAGPRPVSITAWIGGSYLGELIVEITANRDHPTGPHRDFFTEINTEPTEGAVSLVVRYDPAQHAYRFEFRDEDNPGEVTSNLAYDPGPLVEHLVAGLDELAKGRTGYSAAQARGYLMNSGAGLWQELVPKPLREQFWDRQHRIRQLTILADRDAVPWELLYPRDPGHDAGFLVEQFPVTRAIFGRRPSRRLSLWPARFVLPEGSLPEARHEIDAMRRLLAPQQPLDEVIFALTPLQNLIESGNFGLLHFACHNRFDAADGSSITLDNVQFTPTLMTMAAIDRVLERSAPTIFMNACRSAGLNATYNRLDGWASKFLEAGAAAFIGSLWAVCDGTAREFAQEFYGQLRTGCSLGKAVMRARQAAASQPDDPTWLAYTVYGNPSAKIG